MDTKSKNIKHSFFFKLVAAAMAAVGVVMVYAGMVSAGSIYNALQSPAYRNSNSFYGRTSDAWHCLNGAFSSGATEQEIKNGATLTNTELAHNQQNIEYNRLIRQKELSETYRDLIAGAMEMGDTAQVETYQHDYQETLAQLDANVAIELAESRSELIQNALDHYRFQIEQLDQSGMVYAAYKDGQLIGGTPLDNVGPLEWSRRLSIDTASVELTLGYPTALYELHKTAFDSSREQGMNALWILVGGVVLMAASTLWLIAMAGRSPRHEGIHVSTVDRIPLDMALLAAAGVVFLNGLVVYWVNVIGQPDPLGRWLVSLLLMTGAWAAVARFAVMLSKRIKRHEVIRHTVVFKLLAWIGRIGRRVGRKTRVWKQLLSTILLSTPLSRRYMLALAGYTLVVLLFGLLLFELFSHEPAGAFVMLLIGMAVLVAAGLYFIKKRIAALQQLSDDAGVLRAGDLNHALTFTGTPEIDVIVDNIGNLSDGLRKAVDGEIRAQRMKVELITNVSHDLKTPLTSIISYADLLSRPDITPDEQQDYVNILKAKSARLKTLIEDLFEVSKAQSGILPISLEKLSLNELIPQTLAEYEERFAQNNLQVRLHGLNEKLYILADSRRIWRVLSNVLGNMVKYALPGTRVYIDAQTDGNHVTVVFKNIANYEMNFDPSQIVERFRRGDDARTGDGSGLGLAIVTSFMELLNGRCDIAVDGDLFKVTLTLPKA